MSAPPIRSMFILITIEYLQEYFELKNIKELEAFDWTGHAFQEKEPEIDAFQKDKKIKNSLYKIFSKLPLSKREKIIEDFEQVNRLATEVGVECLINASDAPDKISEILKERVNDCERSFFMLLRHKTLFEKAITLSFIDYSYETKLWKQSRINVANDYLLESLGNQILLNDFAFQVGKILYRGYDKKEECTTNVLYRSKDKAYQFDVSVNSPPSISASVKSNELVRDKDSKKAMLSSLIYYPEKKKAYSVIKGGKDAHEKLYAAFAKYILKVETEFEILSRDAFNLDVFKIKPSEHGPLLKPDPSFSSDPDIIIEKIYITRMLCFGNGYNKTIALLPSDDHDLIYKHKEFFNPKTNKMWGSYKQIKEVDITFLCKADASGVEKKYVASLKNFKETSSSNLKDYPSIIRHILEQYLEKWNVIIS